MIVCVIGDIIIFLCVCLKLIICYKKINDITNTFDAFPFKSLDSFILFISFYQNLRKSDINVT